MAKAAEEKEALRLIAEALAQDSFEAPFEQALTEIGEGEGTPGQRGEGLQRDVAALIMRIRKERLLGAKQGYQEEVARSRSVRTGARLTREALIEKVKDILTRQPELEGKIGFAFRDREKISDLELEIILEDLEELQERAIDQSSKR